MTGKVSAPVHLYWTITCMLTRHFTRSLFIICSVLSGSYAALAQNGRFTVSAGANRIGIKDQVEINYQLQDIGNMSRLEQVPFQDFAVVQGPMTFQQSSISYNNNNQAVQSTTLQITYVVRPLRTGKLVIPPATMRDAAGHTIQSGGMTIDVIPGSVVSGQQQRRQQMNDPFGDDDAFLNMQRQMAQQQAMLQRMMGAQMQQRQVSGAQQRQQQQPQQQQPQVSAAGTINPKDIFIKVSVDKSNVHIGEQVTALYKLYARIPMQVGISKLPALNGFWTQDFEIPHQAKPVDEVIDGQHYQVFLLKKSALFPQQSGTLVLDPAEAQGTARIIQRAPRNPFENDPFFQQTFGGSLMMNDPFFNNSFFNNATYKDVPAHLKSTPVNITVTALPDANKPAGYGNAVGNFTIQGKMDKSSLTTDDAATYQLTISGTGNIKLIEAPKLNLPTGLDTYEPKIIDTITGRTETISGSKIITYTIAPHTPGDYTIPPVAFSYYNPQTGSYTTLQTEPQHLHVTAGTHYKPAATAVALKDIRDNDNTTPTFGPASKPLVYSPGYWSLYALPLLSFFGFIIWKKRNDEEEQDVVGTRARKANKVALKRLVTAQQYLQQGKQTPFYDEVSKAIWLYLSDKLHLPLAHLSKESATQALNARKVPAATLQQLDVLLQHCEVALYAPTGGEQGMQHTYQNAVSLISTLETHL